jgi:hypothetical protein
MTFRDKGIISAPSENKDNPDFPKNRTLLDFSFPEFQKIRLLCSISHSMVFDCDFFFYSLISISFHCEDFL